MTKEKEPGEADFSVGPFHVTLTGKLAYQALIVAGILGGAWYFENQIMGRLGIMQNDILATKISVQALIETAPKPQQDAIMASIKAKYEAIKLAQTERP